MTSTLRRRRTIVAAAAIVLYATVASPQSAAPPAHDNHDHAAAAPAPAESGVPGTAGMPMAGMPGGVMARVVALDERIRTLAIDMNMFVGEMKIETMAALLTALVERQALMRHEMSGMRDGMMMHRMMQPALPAAARPGEEPGTMCAPSP